MENNKLNKILGIVFAFALVAGCASTDTQDSSEAAGAGAMDTGYGDATADSYGDTYGDQQEAAVDLQYVFYFDFDKAELNADVRAELDKHVASLQSDERKVRLEGHADERGTREYNMALGERRANAIANYLIVNGIARYRIETVSYGEERPVAFSHDSAAWEKNRRVELKVN